MLSRSAAAASAKRRFTGRLLAASTSVESAEAVLGGIALERAVLAKASRSSRLERLFEALKTETVESGDNR